MVVTVAGLERIRAAPSLRLLRYLRHCIADEPSQRSGIACNASRRDGVALEIRRPQQSCIQRWPSRVKDTDSLSSHMARVTLHSTTRQSYSSHTKPLAFAAVAHAFVEEIEEFEDDYVEQAQPDVPSQKESMDGAFFAENPRPETMPVAVVTRSQKLGETVTQEEVLIPAAQSTIRFTKHLAENPSAWSRIWFRGNAENRRQVKALRSIMRKDNAQIDAVFQAYLNISTPRIRFMPNQVVADLLKLIRQSQHKSTDAPARYFTVMDDMVRSGVPPSVRDFTSALALVGRTDGLDPDVGLERALDIFSRMEQHGNRRAHIVTFNTLGDLTLRARRFDLFRKVLQQVASRGLHEDRYTYLLRLRYWGLLKKPGQVKRTYRDMVSSGHLVDTTVLNCVIKNLMIANDGITAEQTFERMKELATPADDQGKAEPPENWSHQQQLAKILQYSSWLFQHDSKSLLQLQRCTPTSPNTYTYRLIIRHHCFGTKNLHRIIDLLDEMQHAGLFITRPIFFMVFAGFATTPSEKFSPWNISQLEAVFQLFVQYVRRSEGAALELHTIGEKYDNCCELNDRIVEIILQAYAQHGSPERAREVWQQMRSMWKEVDLVVIEDMEALLDSIDQGDGQGHGSIPSQNRSGWDEDDE